MYFLWYKPSKERDLWERQKFEQQVQVQQQQNEAQQQELNRQQAEKNRLREEEERYRNTPRGRLESEGYTYMGKCTDLWRAYEISDKTADETSGEVEVYSISNGSSTRWIVLYDGDTYQLSRGSSTLPSPRMDFNQLPKGSCQLSRAVLASSNSFHNISPSFGVLQICLGESFGTGKFSPHIQTKTIKSGLSGRIRFFMELVLVRWC